MNTDQQTIEWLLADPDSRLLKKKPFFRHIVNDSLTPLAGSPGVSNINTAAPVRLPNIRMEEVTQVEFMRELDVYSHKALFDENIPSITMKLKEGGWLDMRQYRMGIPFQQLILNKQVRHLCVNRIIHTLLNTTPTEQQNKDFIRLKQAWVEKNIEGAKTQFVKDQKSYGDAALLYFIGKDGRLRTKNISYADGYVIITHKNDEGKHILECLYYAMTDADNNTVEYIDCYDDTYMTRLTRGGNNENADSGWRRQAPVAHGFSECPLVTKRGSVAWNNAQSEIESYEALYNTFIVIQKRHGWGMIYVKGKFSQNAQKINGSVILNDTSMDENADAKVLSPENATDMIETLDLMEQTIMKSSGTTFILPKDIKISGDTSGLAVEMTQELDMATAQDGVIEWQNVANKMMRLFKEGLAIELVNSNDKEYSDAMTRFGSLRIHSEFTTWKPKSEEAHNQMLTTLYSGGNGGISRQTYIEKNTISTPDEVARIQREHEEQIKEQDEQAEKAAALAQRTSEQTIVSEK